MTRPLPSCLKCGLPISFRKNSRGAFVPTNPDGSDHWDACREAINSSVAHRRVVETNADTGETTTWGVLKTGKRIRLAIDSGEFTHGIVRPSGLCGCLELPPWEACAGCPDRLDQRHIEAA